MDAFDSNKSENDIDDGHSPFIPTTDELPLLEPAVMWGALPDNVCQARPQPTEVQSPAPALQRLLAAPPTGPRPQDLITNIYSDQGQNSNHNILTKLIRKISMTTIIPGLIPSKISTWDTGVKRVLTKDEEPSAKRVKRSPSPTTNQTSSVLMNLLVSGCDVDAGYICIVQSRPRHKLKA